MIRIRIISPLLLLLLAARALGIAGERPMDVIHPLDREVPIDFKADWDSTYKANHDASAKEIESLTKDPPLRDRLLRARETRLLQAMVDRFNPIGQQRVTAYATIAGNLWALGFTAQSMRYDKRIVDENPGEIDLAVLHLGSIVKTLVQDMGHVGASEYLDYASDRLLALNRAGLLPDEHPVVGLALVGKFRSCLMAARFAEARAVLGQLRGMRVQYRDQAVVELIAYGEGNLAAEEGAHDAAVREYIDHGSQYLADRLTHPVVTAPDFPRQFDLEGRLTRLNQLPLDAQPAESAQILQADPRGKNLVPWGESRRTSIWASMDRFLSGVRPELLQSVRNAGVEKAQAMLDKARAARNEADLLATYRMFPWTAPGQEALADYAELCLLRGGAGIALRSFREVLAHSTDAQLRLRAQAGAWLALSQDADRQAELEASFQAVAPATQYPWMGGQATAQAIHDRLVSGTGLKPVTAPADKRDACPTLVTAEKLLVRTPPISPWSLELFHAQHGDHRRVTPVRPWQMTTSKRSLLLSGPNALVCFGDDLSKPRWVQTAELPKPGARLPAAVTPTPSTLALADGRIYCLWEMYAPRYAPAGVAAFSEETGQRLWFTADDPAWAELMPAGSPVYADGRIYVMAAQPGFQTLAYLVCLDARSGGMLWRQHIVSQRPTLQVSDGWPYPSSVEVSYHGCDVVVKDGAVYAQTNLGVLARCDARDGTIDWVVQYPRACTRAGFMLARQGSAPIISGNAVVFAPRDYYGVMAVDAATGAAVWENPDAPSNEILGRAGGNLLLLDQLSIAALSVESGKLLWQRRMPDLRGHPCLVGSRIYASAGKLLCLSTDTGATIESVDQPAAGALDGVAVGGNRIYGLAPFQTHLPAAPVVQDASGPATAPAPKLPVKQIWTLRRQFPGLIVPPPGSEVSGRLYLLSQGLLECIESDPRGRIVWQAALPMDLQQVAFAGPSLLLMGYSQVIALDGLTGERRWQTAVPLSFTGAAICGGLLVLTETTWYEPGSFGNGSGSAAAIDLASGKLAWHRPAPVGSHNLTSVTWNGKDICFTVSMTPSPDEKGTYALTCRPSDGVITKIVKLALTPTWHRGFAAYVGVYDGIFYFFSQQQKAPVFAVPLDGSKPPAAVPGDFTGLTYDWHRPELIGGGNWLMLRGNQTYIHDTKDMSRFLSRPRAYEGVIIGDHYYEYTSAGIAAFDLRTMKPMFQSPPTTGVADWVLKFCPDIREFESGVMITTRLASIALDLIDPATGKIKARQKLDHPYAPVPSFDAVGQWDVQSAWVNGMLIVLDSGGVYAYAAGP